MVGNYPAAWCSTMRRILEEHGQVFGDLTAVKRAPCVEPAGLTAVKRTPYVERAGLTAVKHDPCVESLGPIRVVVPRP